VICPYCGAEFPKQEPKTPQQTEAELVQRNSQPEDQKRAYFQKMAMLARSRGYRPGFASAKFLEQYGVWAPRSWSEGLKGVFASDEAWQRLLAVREERKAAEAKAKKEEEEHWSGGEASPTTPEQAAVADHVPAIDSPVAEPFVSQPPQPFDVGPDPWELAEPADAPFADWLKGQGIG
jgi:uncharacterized Zn finger protein (UPF0148 family)